jgi:DNA-binding MarR family transcriptional regulator
MQDDSGLLAHAVVRAFRVVNRASNRAFEPLGISAEQAHVLSVLWRFGPMTMGALQRELALSSPTLTGAIDRLELQDLVRRVPSPDDGRVRLLEPTPAAGKRRRKIEGTIHQIDQACFAAMPVADRQELLRLLASVIESRQT